MAITLNIEKQLEKLNRKIDANVKRAGRPMNIWRAKKITKKHGGETGIRTLGTVSRTLPFQGSPFDHSGISPLNLIFKTIILLKQPENYKSILEILDFRFKILCLLIACN